MFLLPFWGGGATSWGGFITPMGRSGGLMHGSPAAETKCCIIALVHWHMYSSVVQFQSSYVILWACGLMQWGRGRAGGMGGGCFFFVLVGWGSWVCGLLGGGGGI